MATFKVGQRVRIVANHPLYKGPSSVGMQATITAIPGIGGYVCMVLVDGRSEPRPSDSWDYFAPITDPRADEFIADMNRFAHISKTKVTQ